MEGREINQKLKNCKSIDELKVIGKEAGFELTDDEAKAYFEKLSTSGELSDDELGNVSGGTCFRQRGREIYTLDRRQYLIVHVLKSCVLYKGNDGVGRSRGTCKECHNLILGRKFFKYNCKIRTWDNDPLNP